VLPTKICSTTVGTEQFLLNEYTKIIMLRLLNKRGLPNVVAFNLSTPTANVMALLYERIVNERRLEVNADTQTNRRANYFLSKQFKRLRRYAEEGQYAKFDFLAKKLLRSYAFQVQAYNSVFPKWFTLSPASVGKHLRYLRKLCYEISTDLDYKRVWIDKKPGDFARPLGVPSLVWRVYLRMLTNLGEVYLDGSKLYSDFQHGGRPGKGVMTCLQEMIENLYKFPRLYEFDLKGFFDHVSKDSVKEFFKGTFLSETYYALLFAKPSEYSNIEEIPLPEFERSDDLHDAPVKSTIDYQLPSEEAAKDFAEVVRKNHEIRGRKDVTVDVEFDDDEMIYPGGSWIVRERIRVILKLEDNYEFLMNVKIPGISFGLGNVEVTKEAISKGRDNWKHLDLPDQGIPQGTSFGPMLASTIAAYYLRSIPNLLMYVDDGMVFLPEGAPSPQQAISDALKPIKVELALEKCRMRDRLSLFNEGVKFLGTRTKVGSSIMKYTTMASETRKGVIKAFPVASRENFLTIIDKMFKADLLTKSKFSQLKWYITYNKSRLAELLTRSTLDVAMRWGFFGNLLAEAYSPEVNAEDMKRKIAEGMETAQTEVMRRHGTLGRYIMTNGSWTYQDGFTGEFKGEAPNLFNLSTFACELLLNMGVAAIVKNKGAAHSYICKGATLAGTEGPENTTLVMEPAADLKRGRAPETRKWLNKRYVANYAAMMAARRGQISTIKWRKK